MSTTRRNYARTRLDLMAGYKLQAARVEAGRTQAELAEDFNAALEVGRGQYVTRSVFTQHRISKLETGLQPLTLGVLAMYASVLELDVTAFLTGLDFTQAWELLPDPVTRGYPETRVEA